MPYGLLLTTGLTPSFLPLVPSIELSKTKFDFEIWDTLGRLGDPNGLLEGFSVVEGLFGLHLLDFDAATRGIAHGQPVQFFLSTYSLRPISSSVPVLKFRMDLTAYVHKSPVVSSGKGSTPVVGLGDILGYFDILHSSGLISANNDGDIDTWQKSKILGTNLVIRKKVEVLRSCS